MGMIHGARGPAGFEIRLTDLCDKLNAEFGDSLLARHFLAHSYGEQWEWPDNLQTLIRTINFNTGTPIDEIGDFYASIFREARPTSDLQLAAQQQQIIAEHAARLQRRRDLLDGAWHSRRKGFRRRQRRTARKRVKL